jgi:hypothetical protein
VRHRQRQEIAVRHLPMAEQIRHKQPGRVERARAFSA